MQIGPQSVHFKVIFIPFYHRTLSFGAFLSDRFVHILIGEKIAFLAEIVEKGAMLFQTYLHENRVADKNFGDQIAPLRQAKEMDPKKMQKTSPLGQILLYKITLFWQFLGIFGYFCHFFCNFWSI